MACPTNTRLSTYRSRILVGVVILGALSGCGSESAAQLGNLVTRPSGPPAAKEQFQPGLVDLNGRQLWPEPGSLTKAIAMVFILPDCPICNAYLPELNRLHADLAEKDVRLVLVHAD